MMKFHAFSRSLPCPVCDGGSNCRYSHDDPDFILCHGEASASLGEQIRSFICVKPADNGHTASFKIDNSAEWTEERRREWEDQKQARLQRQEEESRRRIAEQLPAVERERHYRKILELLSLSTSDRHSLRDRGLTDAQIDRDGYRSVVKQQPIDIALPNILPGVLRAGFGRSTLNICGDGILCPVFNKDGLIVGCQLRLHDSESGRYRWLSSSTKFNPDGASPHLDGELPIGVYEPSEFIGDSIWITEGVAIKPSITRDKLGVPVVGAAGGWFSASPLAAAESLSYFRRKYGIKIITLAVDAGDVINTSGVPERWYKQIEFFQSLGFEVRIAWWGQVSKLDCDIDEIDDSFQIKYISQDSFKKIVNEQRSRISSALEPDKHFKWWKDSRKFTPDIVVNQKDFSFPDNIPEQDAIIAVKSGLGTNKTGAMLVMMKKSQRGSFLEGYRNNLLIQTISRGAEIGLNIYHLQYDNGYQMVADTHSHVTLCLDSIHHTEGYYQGRDIYLDEAGSVILHALNGGTLGDEQAKVIRILTQALNECNRVFLLDGNLSNLYVDFIARVAPNKRVIKIENQQKIPAHNFVFVEGINGDNEIKKGDRSPLIKMMLAENVKPFIFSDSKEQGKTFEKLLSKSGKKGATLNSESAPEKWAKDFLSDPNYYIKSNQPDFVTLSPTAESGISVTVNDYFTHKLSFFMGIQSINSQYQALLRLRDNSPEHFIFCPEKSMVKERSTPGTYFAKQFLQLQNEKIMQSAVIASQSSDNPERALKVMGDALARQKDEWWEFSAQLSALDNYEQDNLRKCLIYALEDAGHNVRIQKLGIDKFVKAKEKLAANNVKVEHATELYKAKEISIDLARELAKSSPEKEVQRQIELAFLIDKLPEIQHNEIWSEEFILKCHLKDKHFITQQQRYWFLKNYEISQKRHEVSWYHQSTAEDFFSARVSRMSHDIVWALRELDILRFESMSEYHKHSPEVIEVIRQLRKRSDIRLALNLNLPPETGTGRERIEMINSLLSLVGLRNKSVGQKLTDGTKLRHYKCVPAIKKVQEFDFEFARAAVLVAIERKQTEWFDSDKSSVNWSAEVGVTESSTQFYVPTVADTESIVGSALVIREFLNDGDWSMIEEFSIAWDAEFKQAVWMQLSTEEKTIIYQLKQSHHQMPNAA